MRVSTDFCYGNSWRIGLSSLLTWAVGIAPSKDTLWTSVNGRFEVPGCPWKPDHENPAVEMHVLLALLSTGPVGISDAIGQTNATLVRRMTMSDGTLLQPARPIVSVDATLSNNEAPPGQVLATHAPSESDARVHLFVSFLLQDRWRVPASQLFPVPEQLPQLYAIRAFDEYGRLPCATGDKALNGCIDGLVTITSPDDTLFVAPAADKSNVTGGTDYRPTLTAVWPVCQSSGWVLLGELDKYVPLATKRFPQTQCSANGVSATVCGAAGEGSINVSALKPDADGKPARIVVKRKVAIPPSGGCVKLSFGEDDSPSAAAGLPEPLNMLTRAVLGFHDCIQPKRDRRPPNVRAAHPLGDSKPAGCSGGLCLGMHNGPHEGGPAAYPIGNATEGYTSVYATMTVPEPPKALDGITYYIWTDIFFGDESQGRMNQFVPQLILGSALDGSSGAPEYKPHWGEHRTWAFGAHYFFETLNASTGKTDAHAAYGTMFPAKVGETLFTSFDARASPSGPIWTLKMGAVDDPKRVSVLEVPAPYMGLGKTWAQPSTRWDATNFSNLCVNSCWELYGADDRDHLPSSGSVYEVVISRPPTSSFPWVSKWDQDEGDHNSTCISNTILESHNDTVQRIKWDIQVHSIAFATNALFSDHMVLQDSRLQPYTPPTMLHGTAKPGAIVLLYGLPGGGCRRQSLRMTAHGRFRLDLTIQTRLLGLTTSR